MQNEKAIMLREIALQPAFVQDNVDAMLNSVREIVASHKPVALRHGFMIGCGDSYCAALAARMYLSDATGCSVEPVQALEFSRYLVDNLPPDSFVFGISNSGMVSRTIEGLRLSRERGARTDEAARAASDIFFPMPTVSEMLTPFIYKLPFEYLCGYIAHQQNIPFFNFDNPNRQKVNFRQIFHSAEMDETNTVAE